MIIIIKENVSVIAEDKNVSKIISPSAHSFQKSTVSSSMNIIL